MELSTYVSGKDLTSTVPGFVQINDIFKKSNQTCSFWMAKRNISFLRD